MPDTDDKSTYFIRYIILLRGYAEIQLTKTGCNIYKYTDNKSKIIQFYSFEGAYLWKNGLIPIQKN